MILYYLLSIFANNVMPDGLTKIVYCRTKHQIKECKYENDSMKYFNVTHYTDRILFWKNRSAFHPVVVSAFQVA